VLFTDETASDDIISAVRIEDENGFCCFNVKINKILVIGKHES